MDRGYHLRLLDEVFGNTPADINDPRLFRTFNDAGDPVSVGYLVNFHFDSFSPGYHKPDPDRRVTEGRHKDRDTAVRACSGERVPFGTPFLDEEAEAPDEL